MTTQEELYNRIIECYEIVFSYRKEEDWFIETKLFDKVLNELKALFISNDLLSIDFWYEFYYEQMDFNNNLVGKFELNSASLELLYFKYIILDIFSSYILKGGSTIPYQKRFNWPIMPSIKKAGLKYYLLQKEDCIPDEFMDAPEKYERDVLSHYNFNLSTLEQLFYPFITKKISLSKKNHYLNQIRESLPYNEFLLLFRKIHTYKIYFEQFEVNLSQLNLAFEDIITESTERGFRVSKSSQEKVNKIYKEINNYIIDPENGTKKQVFDKIFSNKQIKGIDETLNLKDENIWLMPYIVKKLVEFNAFSYPAGNKKHWKIFEIYIRLNGQKFTENQMKHFNIPSGKEPQTLKYNLDLILGLKKTP